VGFSFPRHLLIFQIITVDTFPASNSTFVTKISANMLKNVLQLMQQSLDIIFGSQLIVHLNQKTTRTIVTILNRTVTISTFPSQSSVKHLNLNLIAFEVSVVEPHQNVLTAPSRVVITACVE
jgi:hypothetical protein